MPSSFPNFVDISAATADEPKARVLVLTKAETSFVPEASRADFEKSGDFVDRSASGSRAVHYLTPAKAASHALEDKTLVSFSEGATKEENYFGVASSLLSSAYTFSRKAVGPATKTIFLEPKTPSLAHIKRLAGGMIQSQEWANGRGDVDGTPAFFLEQAQRIVADSKGKVTLTSFKGKELVEKGFRLMHAVGRGSANEPTFINLNYQGGAPDQKYLAFVGKGVCFDTGGYQIKPSESMKPMFLDKHGAASVLAAFKFLVEEQLPLNLTCSVGMVENFISSNAYRPFDIFTSRKGLTVEIGHTDAEGRLVLADCMNWTQETYKVEKLIELSTLTGAIVMALGSDYAGLFCNEHSENTLKPMLLQAGKTVSEQLWHMPLNDTHREVIKPKAADLTNSSGKPASGSSQAAAFLENFVEEGVEWTHLDIAGATETMSGKGNGYGTRLLIQFTHDHLKKTA